MFAEHRQGRSHQGGGNKKEDSANNKAQQTECVKRGLAVLIDKPEKRLGSGNQKGQQQRVQADFSF